MENLKGKTIQRVDVNYFDGCLFEFTDGSKIVLRTTAYSNGKYKNTEMERIS